MASDGLQYDAVVVGGGTTGSCARRTSRVPA